MIIHQIKFRILLVITSLTFTSIFCLGGSTTNPTSTFVITLNDIQGVVQYLNPDNGTFLDAGTGLIIEESHQILSHPLARARLDFPDGTIVRIGELSLFTLDTLRDDTGKLFTQITLEVGEIWILLKTGSIIINTPAGRIGTQAASLMHVFVERETLKTTISCLFGICEASNEAGSAVLLAGQKTLLVDTISPPITNFMTDGDVNRWLQFNPEANDVIIPLTATVAALQGNPIPSPTLSPTNEQTATLTPKSCGPPPDWAVYVIKEGETLELIAQSFMVAIADLQAANCMGIQTNVEVGQPLFVPNVPTVTPTPTPINSPSQTPIPIITPTETIFSPTNTQVPLPNALFNNITAPEGEISTCTNLFEVTVEDPDGTNVVFVEYTVNDPNLNKTTLIQLILVGNNVYSGEIEIPSYANLGTDIVYWRFNEIDSKGTIETFPPSGSTANNFTDSLDCGKPAATPTPNAPMNFSSAFGPNSTNIAVCQNLYSANVTDADGVAWVVIEYVLNDNLFLTSETFPLTQIGTKWSATKAIDTSENPAQDVVFWRFFAQDNLGKQYRFHPAGTSYFYTDKLNCSGN